MHYHRKVIHISADDSPNVRLALKEIEAGMEPSGRILVPGVKDYPSYVKHRKLWDPVKQCIQLDGMPYKGAKLLLFPPTWLDASETYAATLNPGRTGYKRTMGVDSAMGGDNTSWAIGDELGMLHLISKKTPDTSVIIPKTLEYARAWNVQSENILFDAGGGGKPHADRMRQMGHPVRIISFGSSPVESNLVRRMRTSKERREDIESRMVYKNRRAQMYGLLRDAIDPALTTENEKPMPYALPSNVLNQPREDEGPTLRRQLAVLPLLYNGEGQMYLPPKTKKAGANTQEQSLEEMIGCSPDEADAVVLMYFGQAVESTVFVVGRSGMR